MELHWRVKATTKCPGAQHSIFCFNVPSFITREKQRKLSVDNNTKSARKSQTDITLLSRGIEFSSKDN